MAWSRGDLARSRLVGKVLRGLLLTRAGVGGFALAKPRLSRDAALGIRLIAPAFVLMSLFLLFPMAYSLYLSFFRVNLAEPGRPFLGLGNYLTAMGDPRMQISFVRTVAYGGASVATQLLIGLMIALALNVQFRGRSFARGLVIVPWAMPMVVTGIVWKWMFHGDYGVINYMLMKVHVLSSPINWLAEWPAAFWSLVGAEVWKWTPMCIIVLLAGLQAVSPELYEQATVDGAGHVRQFVHITLPMLRSPILVLLVIRSADALRTLTLPIVMTRGGPADATKFFSYQILDEAFRYLHLGYAAALSFLMSLVIGGLAIVYVRLMREDVGA